MDQAQLNWITNFIWGIADDTLRDVFVRGKYRDVILPMTVLRRLDAVLEPTKAGVLEMKAALDREGIIDQDAALRMASGQAFYNTSPFLAFEETAQSKIFPNAAFGYWKVKVERPLRLHSQLTRSRIELLRYASGDEELRAEIYAELRDAVFERWASAQSALEMLLSDWSDNSDESDPSDETEPAPKKTLSESRKKKLLSEATWKRDAMLFDVANKLRQVLGDEVFGDHNSFLDEIEAAMEKLHLKPSASDLKLIVNAVSWRVEEAPPVIRMIHKPGRAQADPLHGLYEIPATPARGKGAGAPHIVEFEPDSELRDYEQIPLLEPGGIEAFFRREVLPYSPDAWLVATDTKIGYEVSFTRHFYQPPQLRTLAQISADILALEQETEGLLHEITKGAAA